MGKNEEPTLTSRACSVDSSDGFSRVAGRVKSVIITNNMHLLKGEEQRAGSNDEK